VTMLEIGGWILLGGELEEKSQKTKAKEMRHWEGKGKLLGPEEKGMLFQKRFPTRDGGEKACGERRGSNGLIKLGQGHCGVPSTCKNKIKSRTMKKKTRQPKKRKKGEANIHSRAVADRKRS